MNRTIHMVKPGGYFVTMCNQFASSTSGTHITHNLKQATCSECKLEAHATIVESSLAPRDDAAEEAA